MTSSYVEHEEKEILARRGKSKKHMDMFDKIERRAAAHAEAAEENYSYNSLKGHTILGMHPEKHQR